MNDLQSFALAFLALSFIVAACVELTRRVFWIAMKTRHPDRAKAPAWISHLWRALSVLFGLTGGIIAGAEVGDMLTHAGAGAAAGLCATTVVAAMKSAIRRRAEEG